MAVASWTRISGCSDGSGGAEFSESAGVEFCGDVDDCAGVGVGEVCCADGGAVEVDGECAGDDPPESECAVAGCLIA